MTTVPQYRGTDQVLQQLGALWQRRRVVALTTALCALTACVAGLTLLITLSAGYWREQPPATLRWTLLILASLTMLAVVVLGIGRWIFWRQNAAQNARFAESALGGLHNALINTVQLPGDPFAEPALVQAAIDETAVRIGQVDLTRAVDGCNMRRAIWAAGVGVALLAGLLIFQPHQVSRAMLAVFSPRAYVPTLGTLAGVEVFPGDATIFSGESVSVLLTFRNDARQDYKADLFIESDPARPMLPASDRSRFSLPLGALAADLRYYIRIGQTRLPLDKPCYTIHVIDRPGIAGLDATYIYPAYTGQQSETSSNIAGPIQALVGTKVRLSVRLQRPVPTALLQLRGQSALAMHQETDPKTFAAEFDLAENGGYCILLCDATGRVIQRLPELAEGDSSAQGYGPSADNSRGGYFDIAALPDKAPKVTLTAPGADATVPPGGKLDIRFEALDDFGLVDAALWVGQKGEPPASEPTKRFPVAGKARAELTDAIAVPANTPKDTVLVYYLTATDNRRLGELAGGQVGKSNVFEILVQDPATMQAQRARRYEQLRQQLEALLRIQMDAKLANLSARQQATTPQELARHGSATLAGQQQLKAQAVKLVETFTFDPEMTPIRQALALLSGNDMPLAVTQAQVLAGLRDLNDRPGPCTALLDTQDKIISALQLLLAYMPSLAGKKDPASQSAGGDLKPEFKEKLKDLAAKLEEFIEAEKKVVAGSERLAKTPVDQFTPDDQKLLKDLQATQDKWEKFLNEAFTDFSKLAQQDFSNPSLLQELISIKTDVTMARDALAQKAAEVATALEDNGIENAETLTTNIEKWLPDVADRQKWDMEDPTGQTNTEMPELPSELEDLVGDLLEQEEDLFQEMDDLTSKYAMSGDKGVGWDAMDGPIASFNAQGVTGNQLPNTNEMTGRSGEGRQGKSSGEFVEDKAVGKGGRRTPTRLTPEPFQQGQINDQSAEPPGGATGGGKLGGAGGEGLEGPVPPPLQKELGRLAGKQAQLVNKAERLHQRFAANDYGNFKFLQGITLMTRVQSDLANYRYQNALRQRDAVIGTLQSSRMLLTRKIDVIQDTSAAVPKFIRDDIQDAMQSQLPVQYRDVLESYLQKLSQGATTQPAK